MRQRQFEEREMSFDEAMALLKVHKSITNLIEEVKIKITRLESMIICYSVSKKAFESKEKPLNQIEITQLTRERENFKEQILLYIPEIERDAKTLHSKFVEEGIVVERVTWSHNEPQTNIYIRLREWVDRLKNFDKISQTTTIKT